MQRILIILALVFCEIAQATYYTDGFLRQPNAERCRTYLGITNSTGGSGSVTNFSSGNANPLFTTSVSDPTTDPLLSFSLNYIPATNSFAGITNALGYTPATNGTTGGSGTVTNFQAGNASPLFTTSVANSTTYPALTFNLLYTPVNAAGGTMSGPLTNRFGFYGDGVGLTNIMDINVVFSDVTYGDASTSMHGFAPKGSGNTNEFLDGTYTWRVPSSGGESLTFNENQFQLVSGITSIKEDAVVTNLNSWGYHALRLFSPDTGNYGSIAFMNVGIITDVLWHWNPIACFNYYVGWNGLVLTDNYSDGSTLGVNGNVHSTTLIADNLIPGRMLSSVGSPASIISSEEANNWAAVNTNELDASSISSGTISQDRLPAFMSAATNLFVWRTNDQVLDTTTITDDDTLSFSLAENERAEIDIVTKFVSGSVGADGIKITVTNTATGGFLLVHSTVVKASGGLVLEASQTGYGIENIATTTDSDTKVEIKGMVAQGETSGTIIFQWSKNANAGDGLTIKSNSYIRITKF